MASRRAAHPLSLTDLFGRIASDENNDGYVDRLEVCIGVAPRLKDSGIWAQVLNLAARLAGEVVALNPPVVKAVRHLPADAAALVVHRSSDRHTEQARLRRAGQRVHLEGHSPARMAEVLHSLSIHPGRPRSPQRRWAAMTFAENGSPAMEAFDRHAKKVAQFSLSPVREPLARPAVEGFDLLDLDPSLYHAPPEDPRARELALSIELASPTIAFQLGLALSDAVVQAALESTRLELPLAVRGAAPGGGVLLRVEEGAATDPRLAVVHTSAEGVILRASGAGAGLARLIRHWTDIGFAAAAPAGESSRQWRERIDVYRSEAPDDAPLPAEAPAAAVRRRVSWEPETERMLEIVRRTPLGRGEVRGLALVSRPAKARAQVRRELERELRAKGYRPNVRVLNAYKPGLSWLREIVQPALAALAGVDRVRIACRTVAADPPGMEMRSRWLQEIYPGPDMLAAALGLPIGNVRLLVRDRLPETYVVTARDRDGRRVYQEGFTPRTTRLPYLTGRAEPAWVHPCTGGIRLVADGRILVDEDLPTDREVFWRFYQEAVLPALEAAMADRLAAGGGPPPAFWEEAAFDVRIPEADERLGLGEERIAPLEALHEDLYFGLLEHFASFAERHRLPAESQFGRILPRVSTQAPSGRPAAVFKAVPFTGTAAFGGSRRATVTALGIVGGRLEIATEAGGKGPLLLTAARLRAVAAVKAADGRTPVPPLDRRYTPGEVDDWVGRLGGMPHLHVSQAGTSWQGRPIRAVEAVSAGGGRRFSVARLRRLKPSLLVNARHHANEVSSTTAALRLAWELAATPKGRAVLKRVNVVIIPVENVDGVATLAELLPGCEGHKLHAARYNALGVEWYGDYFRERPRFPEARVKPLLWRRWLPLLVHDMHGVPSHEWEQPFAGYAPGRFRAYWIPRAFLYAILPFIEDPAHPGHRAARTLARVMALAVGADPDLRRRDRELKERYERYARLREPQVFPPAGRSRLTVLPSDRRLAGLNFGVQRWPVTVSEIVTEVTDEVVSGPLLAACARAHLTVAWSLLRFLARQAPGRLVRRASSEGGLSLTWEPGTRKSSFP
jgi:hypothetical protein